MGPDPFGGYQLSGFGEVPGSTYVRNSMVVFWSEAAFEGSSGADNSAYRVMVPPIIVDTYARLENLVRWSPLVVPAPADVGATANIPYC